MMDVSSLVLQDSKVCDELEQLSRSENKGVNIETDTFVTHVGFALSRPNFSH